MNADEVLEQVRARYIEWNDSRKNATWELSRQVSFAAHDDGIMFKLSGTDFSSDDEPEVSILLNDKECVALRNILNSLYPVESP